MTGPNWGHITSGTTFEALATMLVYSSDPLADLFGRPGKDGGQDAISGDGKRVFQAKYHVDASPTKTINDALNEAKRIGKHRTPKARRYAQWRGVKYWRLMTNARFNPTDRQNWKAKVAPVFKKLGLTVELWDRRKLEADLAKFPEVQQHFFGGETRVMRTLPEAREGFAHEQPFLKGRLGRFFGRKAEQIRVSKFLAAKHLFLAVHGAGGTGKTRFLLAAGDAVARDGKWQVFWALPNSMAHSSTWFRGVNSRRPTLLLLDEPSDSRLLDVLAEQLGGPLGMSAHWKVMVATRSANDPVVQTLSRPNMESLVERLPLPPLPADAAEAMCNDLLKAGAFKLAAERREQIANDLARRFAGHPVWITLAVDLLKRHGDLSKIPVKSRELAAQYIDEIVNRETKTPSHQTRALLSWVALLGTVNRSDTANLDVIAEGADVRDRDELLEKLARLVERKALVARGADDRLVELKPDVLRDHVLQEWLTVDTGRGRRGPSAKAKSLVDRICTAVLDDDLHDVERHMLMAVGRTQLLFRLADQPVSLLQGFFARLRAAVSRTPPRERIRLADILRDVAVFDPLETISLLRQMRETASLEEAAEDFGYFRAKAYNHDDVVLALASPAFRAARSSRSRDEKQSTFHELCVLTEHEAEVSLRRPAGLPNDGGRAAQLLKQAAYGGHGFWGDFVELVRTESLDLLARVADGPPGAGTRALLEALLVHAMTLDRTDEWFEDDQLMIRQYVITAMHPAWQTRALILARVKQILEAAATPLASRVALWQVFARGHVTANQWARGAWPTDDREPNRRELEAACRAHVQDDLAWVQSILTSRPYEIEELQAARNVWHWHVEHGPESPETRCARALEALYAQDALVNEFEPLFDPHDVVQGTGPATKAASLACDQSSRAIDDFIERGSRFVGGDAELVRLARVMWCLGTQQSAHVTVQDFIHASLARPTVSPRTNLATEAAAGWIWAQRKLDAATASGLVTRVLGACKSDEQKVNLLLRLYAGYHRPPHDGHLHESEHALLRSSGPIFLRQNQGPEFLSALAFTLDHDWGTVRPLLEATLSDMPADQRGDGVRRLIRGIRWSLGEGDTGSPTWPADLLPWLFDQILSLPDLDEVARDLGDWYLDEIVRKIGRLPVTWLLAAVRRRMQLERTDQTGRIRALSYNVRLSPNFPRSAATIEGQSARERV